MSSASGISKDYSEPVEYHPTVSKLGNIFLKASNLLLRKASSISIYFVFSEYKISMVLFISKALPSYLPNRIPKTLVSFGTIYLALLQ